MNKLFLLLDGQPATTGQNPYMMWIMLLLIVVVFYFFMIRPQAKQQKLLKNFRDNLQIGDKVLTTSGMYGKIQQIKKEDNVVVLEVAKDVTIKFDINAIVEAPKEKSTTTESK